MAPRLGGLTGEAAALLTVLGLGAFLIRSGRTRG
jgi:hypothetical protein